MAGWNPCKTPHIWEPCEGYSGRYKCAKCHTFGYHKLVTATDPGKNGLFPTGLHGSHLSNIVPYLCPKCHGPTTRKDHACLICRPKVEDPPWKWVKIANGWAVVKDGYRIARFAKRALKYEVVIRGHETVTRDTMADAMRHIIDTLGLSAPEVESGTPSTEA